MSSTPPPAPPTSSQPPRLSSSTSSSTAAAMTQQSAQQPPTQLEFSQAMADFRGMFPDMEADVIEAVLRANNGAVDATIDHLLTMSADNEAEQAAAQGVADQPPAYATAHPPSYQQATNENEDLINLGGATAAAGGSPLLAPPPSTGDGAGDPACLDLLSDFANMGGASGGGTPPTTAEDKPQKTPSSPQHAYSHPKRQEADEEQLFERQQPNILPTQQQLQEIYDENLRLREAGAGGGASSGPERSQQYLEDERVALMLQNEEFMAELRRDTDFMSALEQEQERAYQQSKVAKAKAPMLDEEFREKLKNMGKTSKRKFSQLASMFSRRKGAAKQLLGHAPAPSKDNLLLNAEPLVNEDDTDTEEDQSANKNSGKQQKTPTKGKYTSFS